MDFFVRKPFLSLQLQPRNEEQQSKNNRKEGEGVGEREGEELKGDTANPMLSQKPSRRKTFAPKYPILHTLPTHGSEDCSINVYKQGAYACSLYHPAGNCILCFPNNSILPKNAAANKIVKVDCNRLRNVKNDVHKRAAENIEYPHMEEVMEESDLLNALSWSVAVYSEEAKAVYAFPLSANGKIVRVDKDMKMTFVGDSYCHLLSGGDPRSSILMRGSLLGIDDTDLMEESYLFSSACEDPESHRIFAIPFDAKRVIVVNPENDSVTFCEISTQNNCKLPPGAYTDATYSEKDKSIYMIPGNANHIARINLKKGTGRITVEQIGPPLRLGERKFSCGIEIEDKRNKESYIYCIPDCAPHVYRIGPIQSSSDVRVESIGMNLEEGNQNLLDGSMGRKYSSAVRCKLQNPENPENPENYAIFCIPEKAGKVLCIDPHSKKNRSRSQDESIYYIGIDQEENEYCGAILMDEERSIYALNRDASAILWIMTHQRVVERVTFDEVDEQMDGSPDFIPSILPPIRGNPEESSYFAIYDDNPRRVKHFPSRLTQLTKHNENRTWNSRRDIEQTWRDIHLLALHTGSSTEANAAFYEKKSINSLIEGCDQDLDFQYSLETLLNTLLNMDGSNESKDTTIRYTWLSIGPFFTSLSEKEKRLESLKDLFDDKLRKSGSQRNLRRDKRLNQGHKGNLVALQKKDSVNSIIGKKEISRNGVAACLIKAIFDIVEELNFPKKATEFEHEKFKEMCEIICRVLYTVFSHDWAALKHELDDMYPAKDKYVVDKLLRVPHLNKFLVCSGTCDFLANSDELRAQIEDQIDHPTPKLHSSTEMYLEVLISIYFEDKKNKKEILSNPYMRESLQKTFSGTENSHSLANPFSKPRSQGSNSRTTIDKNAARKYFTEIDTNNDGYLDRNEIKSLLEELSINIDKGLEKGLEKIDKNKDGKISFEEFLGWFSEQEIVSNSLNDYGISGSGSEQEPYLKRYYSSIVDAIQKAARNVLRIADHSDDDLQRRRLRRAAFGALCNSSEPNVKKLFLVPATVLSSKSSGNGPTPDHASWFMDTWFMDTDEILVEYFVLSSKVVFTAKNGNESKALRKLSEHLASALAKMDHILTRLLVLSPTDKSKIAQTSLAEDMVTMSLRKPLAVLILTLDICSLAALLPTLATAFRYAIIDKSIPAILYGEDVHVSESTYLEYLFVSFCLFFLREVWKIGALFAAKLIHIYFDTYNMIDLLVVIFGFVVCGIMSNPSSDCTLPKFRVLAALTTGFVWLKVLGVVRILSVDFASFLVALGEIFIALESFIIVFLMFIFAFGQMFVVIFQGADDTIYLARDHSIWVDWGEAYLGMYRMMLGDFERDWFRTGGNDDDADEHGNSRLLSVSATALFGIFQFVVSIILLNVLIAIVSKAYDNAISKGRRNFLSARLNIAALYGAMGLTKENTANVTMHGWRKTVQEKFEDRYPSIYGKLMYSREKKCLRKRSVFSNSDDNNSSDEEDSASKSRMEIKEEMQRLSDHFILYSKNIDNKQSHMMEEIRKGIKDMHSLRNASIGQDVAVRMNKAIEGLEFLLMNYDNKHIQQNLGENDQQLPADAPNGSRELYSKLEHSDCSPDGDSASSDESENESEAIHLNDLSTPWRIDDVGTANSQQTSKFIE